MALPLMLLLMVLGFAYAGVTGLAYGAGAGFLASILSNMLHDYGGKLLRKEASDEREEMRKIGAGIREELDNLNRVTRAILDALPVDHHDLLEMHTPRTQEGWDAVASLRWALLHRRMVAGHGMTPAKVEAARREVIDTHCTLNRMPTTDADLKENVERWRASQAWALKEMDRYHPRSQDAGGA